MFNKNIMYSLKINKRLIFVRRNLKVKFNQKMFVFDNPYFNFYLLNVIFKPNSTVFYYVQYQFNTFITFFTDLYAEYLLDAYINTINCDISKIYTALILKVNNLKVYEEKKKNLENSDIFLFNLIIINKPSYFENFFKKKKIGAIKKSKKKKLYQLKKC